MDANIIATDHLTVYYGKHRGVLDVDLEVKQGEIFGFLGPNGAGKTTTQRVLLDIIRPTKGTAHIFGLNCQKDGSKIRKKIGYLPGELSLYQNMKTSQFLDFMDSLHDRKADPAYRREICERLNLDTTRKMSQYSKGNKQKVGIVMAFMNRADLLILDEPTGGLDPLVQQTVLELVREAKAEGRTVFFSSHILPEVQAVCDRVAIIRDGKLIKTESVETLTKQQFKRVHLTLSHMPPPDAFTINGVKEVGRDGQRVMLEVRDGMHEVMEKALPYGIEDLETPPVTLEEIFLAFYDRRGNGGNHA